MYLFVRDEDARSHLRGLQQVDGRLMRGEAYYIIYQDSLEFDLLHVLGMASDGQRLVTYRLGYNTKPNSQPGFVFCLNILDDSCNESGPQTKHALSTGRFEGQLQLQYHLLDNELVQKGLNQGWIYTCELCVCALQCCV